jgi:peptidylprolyl isomerase
MRSNTLWYCTCLLTVAVPMMAAAFQAPPRPAPVPPPPDVGAPPKDATKLPSGLAFKVLQPGEGAARPGATDMVTVHYTGWTTDGKMFDSSHARNQPSTFPLDQVIKGWGEGVQLMSPGERRRLWIPESLAYNGQAGRPAGMLVFDIELIAIAPTTSVPAPRLPEPPRDAKRTPTAQP